MQSDVACNPVHVFRINGDPDTDYVNANWIDGFERPKAYIATQGPVPNSFISFWRMIWLCKIETIVMVTHEIEKVRQPFVLTLFWDCFARVSQRHAIPSLCLPIVRGRS